MIIFSICWISEIVESFLPFPFPASVIGLLIVIGLLVKGIMKVEHIQEVSDFLLGNMAFFFVPAGVGLINYFGLLKSNLLPFLIICFVSTVLTFVATAYGMKLTMKLMNRRKQDEGIM